MRTPRRVLLFSLPSALAIAIAAIAIAATDSADVRRYTPPAPDHAAPAAVPQRPAPAASAAVDQGPGPLKIPSAALEPARWDDLDGWAGDDHARAFATFYASCRPIVRANAFRAESARVQSARNRLDDSALAGPPSDASLIAALEEVCARAIKAGWLGSEAALQFFETNFVPVRIRKLAIPQQPNQNLSATTTPQ